MVVGEVHALDDRALVRTLRALGDPTRFRMVQEIAAGGELCCGQVAERFDVTQPTISHHLKVLCVAGVLSVRSQGKHRYISLNQPLLSNLASQLPARLMPAPRAARRAGADPALSQPAAPLAPLAGDQDQHRGRSRPTHPLTHRDRLLGRPHLRRLQRFPDGALAVRSLR